MNILVLGVGGNVSQGILKALAVSALDCRVIGACISPLSFGLYTVDKPYLSPLASDPSFPEWLIRICRKERIQAILSGSEPVLAVLARDAQRIRSETGAICIVSPPECLQIGGDKLLTCRWLEENSFNFPRFAPVLDLERVKTLVQECGFPLLAKPRFGKGARGILEIHNDDQLQFAESQTGYVIQEYLGDAEHEFTASCFSDRDGLVRGAIVFRRELLEGTTYRAELGLFPAVRNEAIRIATALRPMGPCNIQMRSHRGAPVCFEINVRFSGTTPMRARFGFNDVEAALRHYVLNEHAVDLPLVTTGTALRYWNEAYVNPERTSELRQRSELEPRNERYISIEDYGMS